MFSSIYSDQLSKYYDLRSSVLGESAKKHELCYLRRFDSYVEKHADSYGQLTEDFINAWIGTLSGKSSSIENEVITIRQFLNYLKLSGEKTYLPIIPKVREDYVPYIFSDEELERRRAQWSYQPPKLTGYLAKYVCMASFANKGGVLDYRK